MWKKISPPVKLKLGKEIVAVSGVIEIILGTYIGVLFGLSESQRAWLFVLLLSLVAYLSTKLWIWCLGEITKR